MSYWLFLSVGGLTVIFRRNKIVCSILVFLFWIAMTFNTTIADRGQYQNFYNDPIAAKEEWGYTHLQLVAKAMGLSFQVFFAIVIGLALLLMVYSVFKASLNPGWTLVFYLIFPFTMDAAQIRSFIAAAFITVGLTVLAQDRSWLSIAKYWRSHVSLFCNFLLFCCNRLFCAAVHFISYYDFCLFISCI